MRDIVSDHLGKPTSLPAAPATPEAIPSDRGWIDPAAAEVRAAGLGLLLNVIHIRRFVACLYVVLQSLVSQVRQFIGLIDIVTVNFDMALIPRRMRVPEFLLGV